MFWNLVGAVIGFGTFFTLLANTPTPESECKAFNGLLVAFKKSGRSTTYAVLKTEEGQNRYRTNSRLIGKQLYQAPIGTHVAGLLDDGGQIVSISLNHKPMVDYDAFYDEERKIAHLCAWPSLLLGCWGLLDALRWLRRSAELIQGRR